MCGAKLVEVDTLGDYESAFTPRTAMAFFFNAAEEGRITHAEWLRVAHGHGVPCFLDAAADVPPIANLWNYTTMGYDLVAFSGGKGIRGPQNAGLLLGRKDLIAAAAANNNPNDRSVGRGMKVAKEQIVGMVAALDWLLEQTDEAIEREARRRAEPHRRPPARPSDAHDGSFRSSGGESRPAPDDPLRPATHRHHAGRRRHRAAGGAAIDRAQSCDGS
jgi:L-seryl-tRNA(Ser) seleniumtransferase